MLSCKASMEIIVVRYKNPESEERCLESIRKFTDLKKHKLTVFDNSPENINLGKVWNKLIYESKEDIVCLLNSDCVVEEGWVGEPERNLIATVTTIFIGISTYDKTVTKLAKS